MALSVSAAAVFCSLKKMCENDILTSTVNYFEQTEEHRWKK